MGLLCTDLNCVLTPVTLFLNSEIHLILFVEIVKRDSFVSNVQLLHSL